MENKIKELEIKLEEFQNSVNMKIQSELWNLLTLEKRYFKK